MKHYLLTGATGFLGSHILVALIAQGHKVSIIKRSTSDTWRIACLMRQVIVYDIDTVPIEDAFRHQKVDAVIHTACCYGRDMEGITEVADTNLMLGLKLLEAAVSYSVKTFVNTDTLLPKNINPYSLSKKQFVEWLQHESKHIKVVNLKIDHMFGPKDDQTKFVPWLISQIEQGKNRIPLTQGHQLRDFIFIDDVVTAYLIVLTFIGQLPSYNSLDISTGNLVSVRNFATIILEKIKTLRIDNKTTLGFGDLPSREGEPMTVHADATALRNLGWQPKYNVEESLENYIYTVLE